MIQRPDFPIQVAAIAQWPGAVTRSRRPAPFKSTLSSTYELLGRELGILSVRNATLGLRITERDRRQDGWIRADARLTDPGVVIEFDRRWHRPGHGTVDHHFAFPCDTFTNWQDNLRAIALSLEALRKVDRYGVTSHGEQYAGFAALPPSTEVKMFDTADEAARWLIMVLELGCTIDDLLSDSGFRSSIYRLAAKRFHPDAGGSDEQFKLFQEARRLIDGAVR